MADFTKTITNAFSVFGLEAATLWGAFNWGTGFWGYGSETAILAIDKRVFESVSPSDSVSLAAGFNVPLANSLAVDSEPVEETLRDGNGYAYVFTRPSIDAEDRNLSSFVSVAPGGGIYSEPATATTNWSEQ